MIEARWNNQVIARSKDTVVVESNHYFPPESVDSAVLQPSDKRTRCPWKGEAHYHHVTVDGEVNRDAAWFYPEPLPAAKEIAGHIAFWRGVEVGPTSA